MSLPPGWNAHVDPASGNSYYHCVATGEVTWTKPEDAGSAIAAKAETPIPQQTPTPQQGDGSVGLGMQDPSQQWNGSTGYGTPDAAAWTAPQQASTMPAAQVSPTPDFSQSFAQTGYAQAQPGAFAGGAAPAQSAQYAQAQYAQAQQGAVAGGTSAAQGSQSGTVKNWNAEKGFGFIDPANGGENVFVHKSALADGDSLTQGSQVQFELEYNDRKGKMQATNVTGAQTSTNGAGSWGGAATGATWGGAAASNAGGAGEMQATGTVKVWFEEKGFGFLVLSSGEDCYVHRTRLTDGQALVQGATVNVACQWDPQKNKYQATSVTGAVPQPGKGGDAGKGGGDWGKGGGNWGGGNSTWNDGASWGPSVSHTDNRYQPW